MGWGCLRARDGESLCDELAFEESLMMERNQAGKDWETTWRREPRHQVGTRCVRLKEQAAGKISDSNHDVIHTLMRLFLTLHT